MAWIQPAIILAIGILVAWAVYRFAKVVRGDQAYRDTKERLEADRAGARKVVEEHEAYEDAQRRDLPGAAGGRVREVRKPFGEPPGPGAA